MSLMVNEDLRGAMAGPWTTRRLLGWMTGYLSNKGVERPRLVSELLLGQVLGVERLRLYMEMDRPASSGELSALRGLVERAGAHEPVDYLVGGSSFYSMWLGVTPDVLVPRPSTETLVDHVISRYRDDPGLEVLRVVDVGTGSGAIAITLAKHLPGVQVVATDISERALCVASENARMHGVFDQIEWLQGDLLEPLEGRHFDILISNPPYISDTEWQEVPVNVAGYEPELALRGGCDGLDYLRVLIERGSGLLRTGGQMVLEIAASQHAAVLKIADTTDALVDAHVINDHEGLPRVFVADLR